MTHNVTFVEGQTPRQLFDRLDAVVSNLTRDDCATITLTDILPCDADGDSGLCIGVYIHWHLAPGYVLLDTKDE